MIPNKYNVLTKVVTIGDTMITVILKVIFRFYMFFLFVSFKKLRHCIFILCPYTKCINHMTLYSTYLLFHILKTL